MKCGKCDVKMKSNGIVVFHSKELEEWECPKCKGISRVEVI